MTDMLKSKKFIAFLASFLASISAGIAGMASGNEYIILTGIICGAASGGIYQIVEGQNDKASINASTTITTVTATAVASQKQANELVQNVTDTTKKG